MLRMLLLALSVMLAAPALAADDATPPPAKFFVLIYTPGPAWKAGLPMRQQSLGPHLGYMKQLRDTHVLFAAGPLIESNGGLILLKAASLDDARAIMAHDPAIDAGIFTGQAQSWVNAFEAGETPAAFLAAH